MTRLYVVRHGETEWSRDGKHTSVTDLPLTAHGRDQALGLFGQLNPADFGLVLSSPRKRARITAELAGFVGSDEPEIEDDLAEWFYGDYEGRTSEQIQESEPGWTIWQGPVPGGESKDEVTARLTRVVDRVRSSGVDQAIVFGHGHASRALTMCWLGLDVSLGVHFPLDTSTVSVLGEEKGLGAIQQWNVRL